MKSSDRGLLASHLDAASKRITLWRKSRCHATLWRARRPKVAIANFEAGTRGWNHLFAVPGTLSCVGGDLWTVPNYTPSRIDMGLGDGVRATLLPRAFIAA